VFVLACDQVLRSLLGAGGSTGSWCTSPPAITGAHRSGLPALLQPRASTTPAREARG
jgi:hypothetical protein